MKPILHDLLAATLAVALGALIVLAVVAAAEGFLSLWGAA